MSICVIDKIRYFKGNFNRYKAWNSMFQATKKYLKKCFIGQVTSTWKILSSELVLYRLMPKIILFRCGAWDAECHDEGMSLCVIDQIRYFKGNFNRYKAWNSTFRLLITLSNSTISGLISEDSNKYYFRLDFWG